MVAYIQACCIVSMNFFLFFSKKKRVYTHREVGERNGRVGKPAPRLGCLPRKLVRRRGALSLSSNWRYNDPEGWSARRRRRRRCEGPRRRWVATATTRCLVSGRIKIRRMNG